MGRQYKFRAWDKKDKVVRDVVGMSFYHDAVSVDIEYGKYLQDDAKRFELMQYTGLKDKNGTEIYEGDVVLDKYEEVKIVQWYEGQFVVTRQVLNGSGKRFEYNNINNHINHYSKFEVIGNIYENPNFLEFD